MKIQFDIPPGSARETNGLAVRYAAAKRQVPRWRWYLLLALVLLGPAYLLVRFGISYWWETTPAQVVVEQSTVRSQASGRIARVAEAGERLQPGQPVLELEAPASDMSAQSGPAPASAPAAPPPERTARQALFQEAEQLAQRRLAIQQERLQRFQSLRSQGAATQQELDNARFQELQAQADLSRAHADLREFLAQEQAHTSALPGQPAAPAQAARPEATRSVAAQAPYEATVLRALVRPGDWVTAGTEIAVLQGHAEPLVYAFLPPEMARYAQVGREATLRFMDGARVRARVVGMAAEAQSPPADRVSPLTPRTPAIVVRLQALQALPPAYHIHQLPLDVRFDWVPGTWF